MKRLILIVASALLLLPAAGAQEPQKMLFAGREKDGRN